MNLSPNLSAREDLVREMSLPQTASCVRSMKQWVSMLNRHGNVRNAAHQSVSPIGKGREGESGDDWMSIFIAMKCCYSAGRTIQNQIGSLPIKGSAENVLISDDGEVRGSGVTKCGDVR